MTEMTTKKTDRAKPISLAPLSFDEALAALVKVKPEPKLERKKANLPKKTAKKRQGDQSNPT